MVLEWSHFERRALNFHVPSLVEIQTDNERLKNRLTDLLHQVLNLTASIWIYDQQGPAEIRYISTFELKLK